ncbi:hypothetical protein OEZ86_000499 [Tetradesmus obliquus]|nr:hypothetical protein OEZ86_000499 [Tetradesmus obliquus]
MPNPNFFPWGSASSSLLALPRPSYCPTVGSYVALRSGSWDGPMAPCDYGVVLEDTGVGSTPYLVQELVSGALWAYPEAALQPVPEERVPHDLRHPPSPGEGSYVTCLASRRSAMPRGAR